MKKGSTVKRVEDRETVEAVVLEIDENDVLIEYLEGGQGWWPIECLIVIDEN